MEELIPESPSEAPPLVLRELSPDPELLTGLAQAFRALRHRNFRLFVTGQIISMVGTWMQNVAQAWLVYRLTHSELLLGTVWFCTQIPVFAFGSLGGLAADRYSRHKLVVVTQILSMLQAFVLATLTLSGKVQVWQILVLAIALGTINAFDMPGRQSLIVEMTSKDDLLNAISLNSAIFNGARVIGPAVAGLLVAVVGEGICFLMNGVSFLAVIACLLAMRLPRFSRTTQDSPWAHLVQGFKYVNGHRAVRMLLAMMGAVTIAGMPALVLMPFFAEDIFHRGSRGLGFLMGAMGAGAVAGTLVLAWKASVDTLPKVIFWSALLMGAAFCIFAWSNVFYFSLAIMPLIGYSVMRQMASANTLIQTLIPDAFRGRTMAFYSMAVVGLGPFGSLAAGALAKSYGARITVAAGGVLAMSAAAIFRMHLKTLGGAVMAKRKKNLLWIPMAALLAAGVARPQSGVDTSQASEIFSEIGTILNDLHDITGFKIKHQVPAEIISRDKLKEFLEKRMKETASPEEIRVEELTLKKFGFAPADFDLAKNTIDLLTEQAAAFYDFHRKRMCITDWTPSATREPALVHELGHALADQNVNLEKFIKAGRKSDDGSMARLAVMEGQASWLMAEYLARKMGQSLANSPMLLDTMAHSIESGASEFPVFESEPLYLRMTLVFPYSQGLLFQNAVYKQMKQKAFDEVFRRPPTSTQQVLHPDLYFSNREPSHPELPQLPDAHGYKRIAEGNMGELDHQILIEQFGGKEEAAAIAPHWRGGTYSLMEHHSPDRVVLLYAVEWDGAASAARYFRLYRQALGKKWKHLDMSTENDTTLAGSGDDGHFLVRLSGNTVTSVEGAENLLEAVR